jgi:NTP pyrophosphatase (non-canonical NTP hydrolase)
MMFNPIKDIMDLQVREDLYKRLIETYGASHQMDVTVEEMAELTNALVKYKQRRVAKEAVVTEIADVIICCEQMARYFGLDAVLREKERKLQRQTERLDGLRAKMLGEDEQPNTAADGDGNEMSNNENE